MYDTTEELLTIFRKYLGPNFNLRYGQEPVIRSIWEHYLQYPEGTVILEAPTGSGKSIIAFCLSILFKENYAKGYIIASDISLQNQYEDDIFKLGLNYGSVKGVDNYTCDVNGLPFSLGTCKLKGLSGKQAAMLTCYQTCGYYSNRQRAMNSGTSILNYSYWLLQMNYVLPKMETPPFQQREYTIFDECHKVNELVQNHFSPYINTKDFHRIENLAKFINERNLFEITVSVENYKKLCMNLMSTNEDKLYWQVELRKLERFFTPILNWAGDYIQSVNETFKDEEIPKEIFSIFKILDWCKDMHCKLEDFNNGHIENPQAMVRVLDTDSVKFFTIEESALIRKHLLKQAGFKLFMSATIGDPKKFAKILGTNECKFIQMPSVFDYAKSPIIIFKKYRMGFKEKEMSMKPVIELMDRILDIHRGERGIIHSGSYDITQQVLNSSRNYQRLFSYNESKEKGDALQGLNVSTNGVIIGPSLIEGLNLEDELSRFQILLKVPYPHLKDELVKARMNANSDWYAWKTSLSVLQAIGRSVRNPNDYAVTYILDACFLDLTKNITFPKWFTNRFKIV